MYGTSSDLRRTPVPDRDIHALGGRVSDVCAQVGSGGAATAAHLSRATAARTTRSYAVTIAEARCWKRRPRVAARGVAMAAAMRHPRCTALLAVSATFDLNIEAPILPTLRHALEMISYDEELEAEEELADIGDGGNSSVAASAIIHVVSSTSMADGRSSGRGLNVHSIIRRAVGEKVFFILAPPK
mmetsp:Transcript_24711/g.70873  ORF Transcript_24711/g.70873 Transcript_24711/m.70873 type:complete len:186 (-) Transcript_24711:214-771(-)